MLTYFCSKNNIGADVFVLRVDLIHPVTKTRHRWCRSSFSVGSLMDEVELHRAQLDSIFGSGFASSVAHRLIGVIHPAQSQKDYERWYSFYNR
jgi:hypothetical protein